MHSEDAERTTTRRGDLHGRGDYRGRGNATQESMAQKAIDTLMRCAFFVGSPRTA